MINHDAMLRAVLDNPEDDEPRLDCAGWLEAHGDEAGRLRGEFIRLDVTLARLAEGDPARAEVAARREEMVRRHGLGRVVGLGDWAGQLIMRGYPPAGTAAKVERGFVVGVNTSAANFVADAEALGRSPLIHATFHDADAANLKALAGLPAFWRLRRLRFRPALVPSPAVLGPEGAKVLAEAGLKHLTVLRLDYQGIGDDGLAALAGSGVLDGLAELWLPSSGIGDVGAAALAAVLPRGLRSLRLGGNVIGPAGVRALAAALPAGLEDLELGGNPFGDEGVSVLASSGFTRLTRLYLDRVGMGQVGVAALADAGWLANVRELCLNDNPVGPEGAARLAASPNAVGVEKLLLMGGGIGDGGAAAFARPARFGRLKELHLGRNGISDAGAAALGACPITGLETLGLGENPITVPGLIALLTSASLRRLAALYLPDAQVGGLHDPGEFLRDERDTLKSLMLGACPLEGAALEAILGLPQLSGLETLDLCNLGGTVTPLGPAGARAIASSPYLRRLKTLQLYGHIIGDDGAAALAGATLPGLRELLLGENGIGPTGAGTLMSSPGLAGVTYLILASNPLGDAGAAAIAAAPEQPSLRSLSLGSCGLTDVGIAMLARAPIVRPLRSLHIAGNEIGEEAVRALTESPELQGLGSLSFEHESTGLTPEGRARLLERFGTPRILFSV